MVVLFQNMTSKIEHHQAEGHEMCIAQGITMESYFSFYENLQLFYMQHIHIHQIIFET